MPYRLSLPVRALLLLLVPLGSACDPGDASRGGAGALEEGVDSAAAAPPAAGADPGSPAPDTARTGSGAGPAAGADDLSPTHEPVRVVFLGTSLTAGLGLLRDSDRYTDRIAEQAMAAGLPIEVVNAGVSGETSAGGLRRLDWALEGPVDVLVVELGANDGLRGHDPGAMEANLREIVRRARGQHPGVRVLLVGMEAPPNLGTGYTGAFREVFPRVAREMDLELVPFLLEDVAGVDSLNQDDGIHPNPDGHRIMAGTVWEVLAPVVEEVVRERRASDLEGPARGGGGS